MANSLNQDLEGKCVILKDGSVVTVKGGFGAQGFTMGRALLVEDDKGREYRVDGYDVKKLVTGAKAVVTRRGAIDMQVCVPKGWTDEQVVEFANQENPCGTSGGWQIRLEGDPALQGGAERVGCAGPHARQGFVHIMLDA